MKLGAGKLDPSLLRSLLEDNVIGDERVVIRPGIGRDVCAIRMGHNFLVAKTDPVTFATDRAGWYVVHVNANDIATVGARPRWFLLTALLPEHDTDEALVRGIWGDVQEALAHVGCELCGGHTEITVGLDRPILVGQMLGEVAGHRLVNKDALDVGDRILLTKGVPVEGTAVMALEQGDRLKEAFGADEIECAKRFLTHPGISVVREAMAACDAAEVHAMHDPTEGGLATGLWELAVAAGRGLLIDQDRIPFLEPGLSFCRHLGLDPLGTISSGTLLVAVPPCLSETVCEAVRQAGIECTDVGEVVPQAEGISLLREGQKVPMPTFPQDEVTKLFA